MPIKLLIVRTCGSIINTEKYNCQEIGLAQEICSPEYDITVLLAGNNQSERTILCPNGSIKVIKVKYIGINQSLSWFVGIKDTLKKINPDIIQVHDLGMFMSFYLTYWGKRNNKKTILIQGTYETTQKSGFKQLEILFNKSFGKYILNNVSTVGCKTESASKFLNKIKQISTVQTPIGLDIEKFNGFKNKNWRKALSINEGDKALLYIGVLNDRRNLNFQIEILKNLPENYKLIIAGNGASENSLKQQVCRDNLQNRCFFVGTVSQKDVPSLYLSADAFLLTSKYEIYGMVIMESMYFNLPVFSSNTAGATEIIRNGINGYILDSFDSSIWAEKIQTKINTDSYNEIRLYAHKYIVENYLWNVTSKKFQALYKSI